LVMKLNPFLVLYNRKLDNRTSKEKPYRGKGLGDHKKEVEEMANFLSRELPGEFSFGSFNAGAGYHDSIITYHSPDGKDIDVLFNGYTMEWLDPDTKKVLHSGEDLDVNTIKRMKKFFEEKKTSTDRSWLER